MNARVSGGRPIAWEDAGRQIAPLLGGYSAIAVVSSDPFAGSYVALGIARAEAKHRRTVVGDLVGDVPPLRDLVSQEDAHGITDSFVYGVSLNRIGYPVPGTQNLFLMPSGTDPDVGEEVFRSGKWKKIVTGFTEVGGLLMLVAEPDARGLADLVDKLDGVVLVKDAELSTAPSAIVVARVPTATPTLKLPIHRISERAATWRANRYFFPILAAVTLLILASVGAAFGFLRWKQAPPPQRAVTKTASAPTPAPRPPVVIPHVPPPVNSADSAQAAQFTVELQFANTGEGANLFVRKNGRALPAAAISPIPIEPDRTIWYRVTAGAYTRRSQADSLLLVLRNSGILGSSSGIVAVAPMALLVDSVPTQGGIADSVRATLQRYDARGLLVYALMQDDGGALIYAGAFASADQSAELTRILRGVGLKPVLVYRIGRAP